MKTIQLLVVALFLSLGISANAQVRLSSASASKPVSPTLKAPTAAVCKEYMAVDLRKGSVREPNHQITNKVKFYESGGKFYIKCVAPIAEGNFIWAQFPFKPGFPTGKITGMKFAYRVMQSPNNTSARAYISQSRITQGPQPFQGVVRLDDPTNLVGTNSHFAAAFGGGFACGADYKTVGFKLVMQPGDVICIEAIRVLFDCPDNTIITFQCPVNLPNPKIQLDGVENTATFTRYRIPVYNYNAFPDFLFSAAPSLPACGANANSARSWVDIYDENNNRLYGFCALGKAADMKNIWFAVSKGNKPPARVKVVIKDRGCNKEYHSNWISIPQS